jgi:chitinase
MKFTLATLALASVAAAHYGAHPPSYPDTTSAAAPETTEYPAKSYPTETQVGYPTESEVAYPTETETEVAYPTETSAGYPVESETGYPSDYVTSTVYTTSIYTVSSCAETVTDCPAHSTYLTTEVVPAYTTVCPAETPIYSQVPVPTNYPESSSSTYCPPTVVTSYVPTGTGGAYPTQTYSQIQVTAGAAVVGSVGGVAALALAALAAF